jgi:hypothetical protein
MNLISPLIGAPQGTSSANSEPKDKSPKKAEVSDGQDKQEPKPSEQKAADQTTEVDNSNPPSKAEQAKPVAERGPAAASDGAPSRASVSALDDDAAKIAADRRAAENRIEQARTRALIDSIAPVANSPAQGSKSYMETLLTSKPAAETTAAPETAAAPKADAAA